MPTNTHQINNYSAELAIFSGEPGTPKRAKFDEEAYEFYLEGAKIIPRSKKISPNPLRIQK